MKLLCPKCNKYSELSLEWGWSFFGRGRELKKWTYNCQYCNFSSKGEFEFYDDLISTFFLLFLTVIYVIIGDSQNFSVKYLIGGGIVLFLIGFKLSRLYIKWRVEQFLKN